MKSSFELAEPPPAREQDVSFQWLERRCAELVGEARFTTPAGQVFYYPAAHGNTYPKLYLRDFVYMYDSAPELFEPSNVRGLVQSLLANVRSDGWAPEGMTAAGVANYRCHGNADVVDSGPFLVKLVGAYVAHTGDASVAMPHLDTLWRALAVLPQDAESGLVWVDPKNPRTAYGFTDTIAITGHHLFCSLLVFEALDILGGLGGVCGRPDLRSWCELWRSRIAAGLAVLWPPEGGMFYAGSRQCRQIDVWGSLFACRVGAATDGQRKAIAAWLAAHRDKVEYRAHLRHLPAPEFWEGMIPPWDQTMPPGEFQNGPYWSTPSGWFAELLEREQPGEGLRFLVQLVAAFREIGVWECIRPDGYRRVVDNLSSALLPYASFKRILRRTPI